MSSEIAANAFVVTIIPELKSLSWDNKKLTLVEAISFCLVAVQ